MAMSNAVLPRPVQPLKPKSNENPEEVTHLKTEMQELKQRIASMTKNIDELTELVNKVSVNDDGRKDGGESPVVSPRGNVAKLVEPESGSGNKRKKVESTQIKKEEHENDAIMDDIPIMPDWNPSSSNLTGVDSSLLDEIILPDLPTSGGRSPMAPSPTPSSDTFVDDLYRAFADEDDIVPGFDDTDCDESNDNKPCPQLMKRIEDSLSTIPRSMHEMAANRFIGALSDIEPLVKATSSLENLSSVETPIKPDRSISVDDESINAMQIQPVPAEVGSTTDVACNGSSVSSAIPLPLAVATLKTILAEYGVSVECKTTSLDRSRFTKALPVVPLCT